MPKPTHRDNVAAQVRNAVQLWRAAPPSREEQANLRAFMSAPRPPGPRRRRTS